MGRGRVVLERIENKINRQVTFSKRRNGLLKKAYELSVLCDAEVALIMFSSRGKLSQFSSNDIDKTLERYRRSSYTSNGIFEHEETLYEEILKLRGNCESLQRSQKHFLGEDIEQLKMKELQHLEELIDRTLSQTRQRKTSMMLEKIEELRRKEQYLAEVNEELTSKLAYGNQRGIIDSAEDGGNQSEGRYSQRKPCGISNYVQIWGN